MLDLFNTIYPRKEKRLGHSPVKLLAFQRRLADDELMSEYEGSQV